MNKLWDNLISDIQSQYHKRPKGILGHRLGSLHIALEKQSGIYHSLEQIQISHKLSAICNIDESYQSQSCTLNLNLKFFKSGTMSCISGNERSKFGKTSFQRDVKIMRVKEEASYNTWQTTTLEYTNFQLRKEP